MIFGATTLGSAMVYFFREEPKGRTYSIILGFAGGIMMSASFFGLILPSIDESNALYPSLGMVPPLVGFLLGGIIMWAADKTIPHVHRMSGVEEGMPSDVGRNMKFFLAVTMHNIPEGLAIGFACGLALMHMDMDLAYGALSLAIGISIQNIPEGAAVSIPLYAEGESRGRAFMFGLLSGTPEPIFGVLGILLTQLSMATPWLLAIAAGAMIYVTLDEILPESRKNGFEHAALWAFMFGFSLMMMLEML